jgi:hypothetical protein
VAVFVELGPVLDEPVLTERRPRVLDGFAATSLKDIDDLLKPETKPDSKSRGRAS